MKLYQLRAEIFWCMYKQGFLGGKIEMLKYDFLGGFSLMIETEIDHFINENFIFCEGGVQ